MIKELTYKEIFLNLWTHCKLPSLAIILVGVVTILFHIQGSTYSPIVGIVLLTCLGLYMTGLAMSWLKCLKETIGEETTEEE